MRVLVLEFVSGGGLAGRPCPPSLAVEGRAMRDALVTDLAALAGVRVLVTADPRFPLPAATRAEVVRITHPSRLLTVAARADAVWAIAPETRGRLARLTRLLEAGGRQVLGSSSQAIRICGNKLRLLRRLRAAGVPVPATQALPQVVAGGRASSALAAKLTVPLVVKPARGAGCEGVTLARSAAELPVALTLAELAAADAPVLLQEYVAGLAASVSLLADGGRAVPLAVNRQHVRPGAPFVYDGGETPLDHPLAGRAIERAQAACAAVPGLRGYVGVDMVLARGDAVVLEINPRLTTSYLGLRRALDANVAGLALEAALGRLPPPPRARRRVRFQASGVVTAQEPLT